LNDIASGSYRFDFSGFASSQEEVENEPEKTVSESTAETSSIVDQTIEVEDAAAAKKKSAPPKKVQYQDLELTSDSENSDSSDEKTLVIFLNTKPNITSVLLV
jgi:hypothetical protein